MDNDYKISKTTYCMSECYIAYSEKHNLQAYGWTIEEAIKALDKTIANKENKND